jgi:WD40 repeat protein
VPAPKPGSDEINHAANDSWIGINGYKHPDGKVQMARAFLGTVIDKNGKPVPEVFVVDIPDDITKPGKFGPLEGTATDFPMPPKGTLQRRLTFTADSKYPGCSGIVRSSPDGNALAYLAKDDKGVLQIFLSPSNGGKSQQLTEHKTDVSGNLRWHPDGKHLSYVWNGSIMLCQTGSTPFKDRYQTLTTASNPAPTNIVWAHDGKMFAFNRPIKVENENKTTLQVFVKSFDPK